MKPFLLLILFSFSLQAQHTISGTISPPENLKQVFLYKSNPSSSSYVDKGSLDQTDSFSITLDSTVSKGIYKIVYGYQNQYLQKVAKINAINERFLKRSYFTFSDVAFLMTLIITTLPTLQYT